jgi:hypothetical protein
MTNESGKLPAASRFQRWIEANRAKIWIWGIAILAIGGVACMVLTVVILIIRR